MRWAGVGPYYAMFPFSFAQRVIKHYTEPSDVVFDPFAGRGTSVFAAAINNRCGIGIEINPVGYIYSRVKLYPARRSAVTARLREISNNSSRHRKASQELPKFFRHCFCPEVREFLVTARTRLDWQHDTVDRTVMALLLVHLHGKRTDSLSNQMRQTKSMSPNYAVEWWKERHLTPPKIDPFEFMQKKIEWRYAKGRPKVQTSRVFLGDSETRSKLVHRTVQSMGAKAVRLLFTSPPYCGITNYHYDQWLRLWLLGGADHPTAPAGPNKGKFVDREKYRAMLAKVLEAAAKVMADDGVVYVRTDSRKVTLDATVSALRSAFPNKKMRRSKRPVLNPSQTALFGGSSKKVDEIDIVLR
jgi:putative NIF3 family GTP cyclohydrolase 1 type 2